MSISAAHTISPEEERLSALRPVPRVILTRAGEQAMRDELGRLRERIDGEFTERLREARESGANEHDEYLQIKEEEAVVASRIRQLDSLLAAAEVLDEDAENDGTVALGSVVEVKNIDSGKVRTHRITGGFEPVEQGDVSAGSPVGEALLGRKAGETVAVELPNGRITTLEVIAVGADAMAQPSRA